MKRKFFGHMLTPIMALLFLGCPNPANEAHVDQVITLLDVPGVVVPAQGEVPVTTSIGTVQYTGTISWIPEDNPFEASTEYTANIVLTAKKGWTLNGVEANSLTVNGASSVTHSANSGVLSAEFPATDDDYTSANIGVLKYVPAGSFQRSATSTNISTITTAYRMSQYEITRAQFLDIMGTDPSDEAYSSGTDEPVQKTNWYHAIAFCNKLSLAEELTPVYSVAGVNFELLTYADIPTASNADWNAATANWSATGYRLPTEMEWMWAAMGAASDSAAVWVGYVNTTGYTKAFAGSTGSNTIGDYAWYSTNSNDKTHPVGTKLTNELGLFDMSGNVWEWCWDLSGVYPTGTVTDYRGATSGINRVMRGGSWSDNASSSNLITRGTLEPHNQGAVASRGFRVVRP